MVPSLLDWRRMSGWELALVAAVGFAGSFYGVTSGGGGLLIIPGLILLGMPGPMAVATSRVGQLTLSVAGVARFRRAGLVRGRTDVPLMAVVTAGSALGALLLLHVDPSRFERTFGVVTLLLAAVMLFGRRLKLEQPGVPPSPLRLALGYVFAFATGVYAGLFGAAWATFFTYVMVAAFGTSFLQGAAVRTFVGMAVGLVTTLIVGLGGQLDPLPSVVLAAATLVGSYAGASFALRRGEGYARQIVALIAVAAGLKLLL